jgi:chromosomal replication initiation ATPase DnaA
MSKLFTLLTEYKERLDDLNKWYVRELSQLHNDMDTQEAFSSMNKLQGFAFSDIILSGRRDREAVVYRHATCYVLREDLKWTYTRIAKALNMDHSSVMYAVEKVKDWVSYPKQFEEELEILNKVKGKLI